MVNAIIFLLTVLIADHARIHALVVSFVAMEIARIQFKVDALVSHWMMHQLNSI